MLENLMNQSNYGQALQQGNATSYAELQKQIIYSNAQLQLQSVQLNTQEVNYQANLAKQNAYLADLNQVKQASNAIFSFNAYASFQRNLNSLSNQLTRINVNVLNSNADALKYSGIRDLKNSLSKTQAEIGKTYAQFGASDVVADTGSALDVANYIEKQGKEAGYNAYNSKLNQANDQLSKSLQLQYSQNYENLSLESKLYLDSLSVNKSIQGY